LTLWESQRLNLEVRSPDTLYEQLEDISGQVDRGQKRYMTRQPS
jgi:hypothetical protein